MLRRIGLVATLLALVVTATAVAAGTTFSGKTNQKLKLAVTVSGSKISKISYAANYGKCGADLFGTSKVSVPIKHAKVSDNVKLNSETTMNLVGKFKGTKFSGSFTSKITTGGIHPQTCSTGKVTFKLTKS
jgi:hypothetical protein